MASRFFRYNCISVVVLLFSFITEANEEWQQNFSEFESEFYDNSFNFYSNDISLDDLNQEKEFQNKFYNNNCLKKLERDYFKKKSKTNIGFSEKVKPYLLPSNHPAKKPLDIIFKSPNVLQDLDSLKASDFNIISLRPYSFAVITSHPKMPGYIQKLYLDSEHRKKNGKEGWEWLVQRCEGAENIRKLIKKKNLQYFTVPDKWIYVLPKPSKSNEKTTKQLCILIVTDMELVSQEQSAEAWKYLITEEHLDELFVILSHGFASSHVSWNIPYAKNGKFTCIDTEHPKRKPNYKEVEHYLSDEMQVYWRKLVKNGEQTNYNGSWK